MLTAFGTLLQLLERPAAAHGARLFPDGRCVALILSCPLAPPRARARACLVLTLTPPCGPRADDVLKARLKTIGVSEYKFELEAGPQSGTEWRIVDVGGSRFQVRGRRRGGRF